MTGAELVTAAPLPERIDYALKLSKSGLLPPAYQDKPANVLYALEYAAALDIPPMTAIMGIHVIAGKPTLGADLMAALIRRAGHRLRVTVTGTKPAELVAIAQLTRSDDPDFTYETRWTLERAQAAGLLGKDNWKKTPAAMLKARAISEVAREGASEVLHGLIYTPEELGATDTPDPESDPSNGRTETDTVDAELVEDTQPPSGITLTGKPQHMPGAPEYMQPKDPPVAEPEKAFPEQDTLT